MKKTEIPTAYFMRMKLAKDSDYEERKEKEIEYQINLIERAIQNGKNYAIWRGNEDFENELRPMFKGKGYKFRPIGTIGGIKQVGEYIYW